MIENEFNGRCEIHTYWFFPYLKEMEVFLTNINRNCAYGKNIYYLLQLFPSFIHVSAPYHKLYFILYSTPYILVWAGLLPPAVFHRIARLRVEIKSKWNINLFQKYSFSRIFSKCADRFLFEILIVLNVLWKRDYIAAAIVMVLVKVKCYEAFK